MSLEVYQETLGRMVALPAFRERVALHPVEALSGLELTERESRRLLAVAAQPGMLVNTAIHRANRLTPLDQTMPFTCFLLGKELPALLERYWLENPTENLQLPVECERFAAFVKREIENGRVSNYYLEEVLEFERVCTELRFYTEQELRNRDSFNKGLPDLVRLVNFRHDPVQLLEALMNLQLPPTDLPDGEFHLLIDYRSDDPDFRLIDNEALAAIRLLANDSSS
jgi:hypothetical protein